jgi:hypothetical protein
MYAKTPKPGLGKSKLLTHNRVLSVTSRKFMRENKGYYFENIPPAVHIGTLFAAVWLQLGAPERIEISRRKLVVACAEAVKIKPELISRMKETLARIVPGKAAQFEAMMSQPRFMQMAQDAIAIGFLLIAIAGIVLPFALPNHPLWVPIGIAITVASLVAAYFEYNYRIVFNRVAKWGERRIRRALHQLGYGEEERRLDVSVETGNIALNAARPDFELRAD